MSYPMSVQCQTCKAKGFSAMHHEITSCRECQDDTCKACGLEWDDETNSTICIRCTLDRAVA